VRNAFTTSPLLSVIIVEYPILSGNGKIQLSRKKEMRRVRKPIPTRLRNLIIPFRVKYLRGEAAAIL
jgi:hypothetical protein